MKNTEKLAPGAPAPEGFIPLCVPEIKGNEWKYIKECLDTNFVSSVGPFVDRFENMVADYVNCKYGVAMVNGTSALHIALLVAGVQPNDEVLVSTLTFIAPANAIRYVGAWPVFIDAEPDYWQMDPQKVVDFLEKECQLRNDTLYNKITGRRIKAILPVHILGHPVDMDPIIEVAQKYNLVVIEDASESLGAKYKGRMVGNLGDIACFSFNGNKLITTGGGGMIVTDNEKWASRAKYLTTQAKDTPIEYIHNEIGYNYRLTNIQAALGVGQFEHLEKYINAKRRIADIYTKAFNNVPGITPMVEPSFGFSTFWMYTILVNKIEYRMSGRRLLQHLNDNGIQARPLWQPMHCSPAHADDRRESHYDVAERLNRDALSLPSSVGLTMSDQNKVIDIIQSCARKNTQ
ncbi:MAG: LegC family aminotransferase [Bacteroidales bacterium]|nr:LegC family aminotransferase [Bacteroidales bacterium]